MRIQTNISALTAQRNLSATNAALQISTTRLSSGFRINRAADDAAGLSIANQMRGDVRALQTAQRNASQAGSVLQIADGATSTIATILDRMKELATQASSANTTDDARSAIQAEFEQLQGEITRITSSTKFQGSTLLNGSFGLQHDGTGFAANVNVENVDVSGARPDTAYTIAHTPGAGAAGTITLTDADGLSQTVNLPNGDYTADGAGFEVSFDKMGVSFTVIGDLSAGAVDLDGTLTTNASGAASFRVGIGDATADGAKISLSLGDLTLEGLGIDASALDTAVNADTALESLETAYSRVNTVLGQIGAASNRLEFASTNLGSIIQNTMAAESTIRDADMAYEMMQFSKQNILAQAGTAMLAQANSLSQSVLQLLR